MIDYAALLTTYYPGTVWSLVGDSYDGIEWSLINEIPKPAVQDLDALWPELQSNVKKNNCKSQAKELIAKTDWSVLPDVNISNKTDFESYRATLRSEEHTSELQSH